MSAQPNMGALHRMLYIFGGAGLMYGGFFVTETAWAKVALPILGALMLIEGFIAY